MACSLRIILGIFLTFFGSTRIDAKPLLAFGDIRGHLEPCGCDPRTDVGGIKRLAAAVERYRVMAPDVVIVHLGNSLPVSEKEQPKVDALIHSIESIKPQVSLVNVLEWGRLAKAESLPNIDWVLSNAQNPLSQRNIVPVLRNQGLEIYGYLGLKDKNLRVASKDLMNRWKKLSKVKAASDRVLLFSGNDKELAVLSNSKFFGSIISSNMTKMGIEIGYAEQKNERSLLRDVPGGLVVWSVPFGGGGLLRAGGLELLPIPATLEASLKSEQSIKPVESPAKTLMTQVQVIHWLRVGEENGVSQEILKIFDGLRQSGRDQFKLLVEARSKHIGESEFVGAEACAACHKTSYDVWSKSKHAGAMMTLINKTRHEDPECVACHVVGFIAKGGYVNEEKTKNLSNVQCENCHGARKAHVENPLNSPKVDAKAACAECHTPPHSPGFDQESYWKKIEHK